MVRALLDGTKTQTRRVVKDPARLPPNPADFTHNGSAFVRAEGQTLSVYPMSCPYGKPGERLWVRETWQGPLLSEFEVDADADWHMPSRIHQYQNPAHCAYAADGGPAPEFTDADDNQRSGWRPSIHMNRWASRISLEITSVHVERLKDISEHDAEAEGIVYDPGEGGTYHVSGLAGCASDEPVSSYRKLWESINGYGSWDANPWVWVVAFNRTK